MNKKQLCAAIGSALGIYLISPISHAQSSSASDAQAPIERISILGSRTAIAQSQLAAASYQFSEAQIQASGHLYLSDLIRSLPSISLTQSGSTGGLTEIRLRGAESNHLVIMIDGVVVNDEGQGGLVDLAHITTDSIAHIELLQGPQSALWGSGAIAGVLNISTKAAGASSHSVSVELGNQSHQSVAANIGGQSDTVDYRFSLQHTDTDGDNIAREGDEDDGYQNTTLTAKLNWQAFGLSVRAVDFENEFDGTDFVSTGLPMDTDDVTKGQQFFTKLDWQQAAQNSDWRYNAQLQYSRNQSENFSAGLSTAETTGQKTRAVAWANYSTSTDAQLNLGLEWVDDDFEQKGPIGFGDPNQTQSMQTAAVFADTHYSLSKMTILNASARWDDNSDFDDQASYRIGPRFMLSDTFSTFVSYGKATRNPTFTERFGFFPNSFIGNPNLKPETAKTLEAGLTAQLNEQGSLQLNWYETELENEINGFVFDSTQGMFTAANSQNESRREGLELVFNQGFKDWSVLAQYSYLDAEEKSDSQNPITELRRANHNGAVLLSYTPVNSQHSGSLSFDYTGSRFDQFFPPFPQPSQRVKLKAYWLISASWQYRLSDSASIQLSANNLFDEDYEDVVGFVGEGRQIRLKGSYHF